MCTLSLMGTVTEIKQLDLPVFSNLEFMHMYKSYCVHDAKHSKTFSIFTLFLYQVTTSVMPLGRACNALCFGFS